MTHRNRFQVKPSSYEVGAQEGEPAGWIAQVEITEEQNRSTTTTKLWDQSNQRFPTKEQADDFSLWIAARWMQEQGLSETPKVVIETLAGRAMVSKGARDALNGYKADIIDSGKPLLGLIAVQDSIREAIGRQDAV